METPDKNRISAVSFCNFEDSPVFQYINGLSPIEPADHVFHSLALASPSSLFSSPQIESYRDSRFLIKRHHSLDPVVSLDESGTVKSRQEDVLVQLNCSGPEEKKPFKEQVKLAIELASSLRNREDDGCGTSQMVSSDEVVPMVADNEVASVGVMKQSDELCRQVNELDADTDMVLETEEMETENGSGEREIPNAKDSRISSFTSAPMEFSNDSGNVVQPCRAGASDTSLSSSLNVADIDSTAKAGDKEETGEQLSHKQRSVRRRCLTFDVGGSYKRVPLRDSTNDIPLDLTSINEAHSPQECVDSSKQETDEILPVPRTIGLHLNALVNPSASSYQNKFTCKDGGVLSHPEEEFATPVSTVRDLVSRDNIIMEEASEKSMEGEWVEELSSCKRCRCKKSKCLKLYCDCFAAGLYCVEPCSCQNCFNRPIHEDVVIESRRIVEARNPLAFAPKVVLTSASATYFGEENNKTPASARHMRGCNCKKSGCSKKYCECYLMGVGCSASCRCIGCKNVLCHTNEQFHLPCAEESDAVTIKE